MKAYVLESSSQKVTDLYIVREKDKMGIWVLKKGEIMTFIRKEKAKITNCPADKKKTIKAARKHFNLIGGNING